MKPASLVQEQDALHPSHPSQSSQPSAMASKPLEDGGPELPDNLWSDEDSGVAKQRVSDGARNTVLSAHWLRFCFAAPKAVLASPS